MTITAEEFLRHFVRHILPHGFVRPPNTENYFRAVGSVLPCILNRIENVLKSIAAVCKLAASAAKALAFKRLNLN
jgi:hypothetical protein